MQDILHLEKNASHLCVNHEDPKKSTPVSPLPVHSFRAAHFPLQERPAFALQMFICFPEITAFMKTRRFAFHMSEDIPCAQLQKRDTKKPQTVVP